MIENRVAERHKLSTYLQVVNRSDGQLVGHFADFSATGFMLISKRPIGINIDFQMQIIFPKREKIINLEARSVWCDNDPNIYALFNVGFKITKIDPADMNDIENWFHSSWF